MMHTQNYFIYKHGQLRNNEFQDVHNSGDDAGGHTYYD